MPKTHTTHNKPTPIKIITNTFTHWNRTNGYTSQFSVLYVVSNGRAPVLCADHVSQSTITGIANDVMNEYNCVLSFVSEIDTAREYKRLNKNYGAKYYQHDEIKKIILQHLNNEG